MTCPGRRPIRALERLHKPFPDPHKFPTQQIPLYQIIERLEEERSRLVRNSSLPAAGAVRDLLQAVADQRPQLLHRLFTVPEEPELFALRQLIFVVVARLGLLHLVARVVEGIVDEAAAGNAAPDGEQPRLQAKRKAGQDGILQGVVGAGGAVGG